MMPGFDAGGPLAAGTLLAGRYHIERVLRAGHLDRRYLVVDTQLGGRSLVAQELVPTRFPTAEEKEQAVAWFDREVDLLQGLAHQAICPVRGSYVAPGSSGAFYLLLDMIPGLSLAEELEESDGAVSWRLALDWGIALCEALVYLHGQRPPRVFGTVQPQNVVLDARTERPVLVEFGLGRQLDPTAGDRWGYVPFEQYIGRTDPRSDLYALGATLRTLVSGDEPDARYARLRRTGLDVQRTLRALFPSLDATQAGIPPALAALIGRATAFSADERFPDAEAMLAALRAVRGPAVEVEEPSATAAPEEPVWTRLSMTQEAWFALPAMERNRRLLSLVKPPPPPP